MSQIDDAHLDEQVALMATILLSHRYQSKGAPSFADSSGDVAISDAIAVARKIWEASVFDDEVLSPQEVKPNPWG